LRAVLHWDGTPIEALLLDLDDTILDNRAGLDTALREFSQWLAGRLGDAPPAVVQAQLRASSEWFWSDDERHRWGRLDMPGSRRAFLTHAIETIGRPAPELVTEATDRYCALRDACLVPFAGALEALAQLRERTSALGLVTNGAAAAQRAKIDRFDLARFFDVIVVEGEAGFGKPDRRVFERALAAVAVAPARALMAGDNYECDVLGSLDAGLHAVWIDRERVAQTPAVPPRPHGKTASFVELANELGVGDG
jgi:putative hydrolase of the HAD superfamily